MRHVSDPVRHGGVVGAAGLVGQVRDAARMGAVLVRPAVRIVTPEQPPAFASVWKLNANGRLVTTYDTGGAATAVRCDGSDRVAVAGNRVDLGGSSFASVWRLSNALGLQWTFDTGAPALGVACGPSDKVYACGVTVAEAADYWILDAAGVQVYAGLTSSGISKPVHELAVDVAASSTGSYVVHGITTDLGGGSPGPTLYNAANSPVVGIASGGSDSHLGVDLTGTGMIYYAAVFSTSFSAAGRLDWPSGASNWTYVNGNQGLGYIAAMVDGGAACTHGRLARRVSNSGTLTWEYDIGAKGARVRTDAAGNVYVTGARNGGRSVWRLTSGGDLDWSYDTGGSTSGVDVDGEGNVFVCGERVVMGGGG